MVSSLRLGNCVIRVDAVYPQVMKRFDGFLVQDDSNTDIIKAGDYEKEQYLVQFPEASWDEYAEYKCLLNLASDAMMKHDQLLFHSASILVDGHVWLLSGPSGIGKSTQYRNLKKLYPDQIGIVSGDYPILSFEDNEITVLPSPWNGKENWGSMNSGKLAGIILLKQGKQNIFTAVSPEEAVIPVYHQINTYAKTEEQIHMVAALEERLITSVPIWRYENTGDPESSEILYKHILKEQKTG